MKIYRTHKQKPSELFLSSLSGGGSHHVSCGFCGRDHYCPDSDSLRCNSYSEDEKKEEEAVVRDYLEFALREQKENPDGVIIHYDCDYVSTKDLNGMAFVVDCPCNGLAIYETFIWAERNQIREFLKKRVDQELAWMEQEKTKNKLAGFDNWANV